MQCAAGSTKRYAVKDRSVVESVLTIQVRLELDLPQSIISMVQSLSDISIVVGAFLALSALALRGICWRIPRSVTKSAGRSKIVQRRRRRRRFI